MVRGARGGRRAPTSARTQAVAAGVVVHPTTSAPKPARRALQHRAGAGAELSQAAGRAPHLQPDGDRLAGRHRQPFPDPGRTARRRRLQAQVDRVRRGHPAAPGGQAAQDRPPVEPVGQDHGPGVRTWSSWPWASLPPTAGR